MWWDLDDGGSPRAWAKAAVWVTGPHATEAGAAVSSLGAAGGLQHGGGHREGLLVLFCLQSRTPAAVHSAALGTGDGECGVLLRAMGTGEAEEGGLASDPAPWQSLGADLLLPALDLSGSFSPWQDPTLSLASALPAHPLPGPMP